MNAQTIIQAANAEGLVVDLSPSGTIKAVGKQKVLSRWRPILKQHKAEIVNLLSGKPGGVVQATRPLPHWCRSDCPGLASLPLANEGEVAGCVHPITGAWRRLNCLTACPATEKKTTRPTLPEFCKSSCGHHHRLELPAVGIVEWCCQGNDEKHWRIARIDKMNACPIAKGHQVSLNNKSTDNDHRGLAHDK